ncbi:MAG: hexose kinase [Anaerolineaceae bacterium]|nr:hexose kinase [Anaerolineaceae bacterium]
MIFTHTANPSIDRSVSVPKIRFNEVLRCNNADLTLGGKAINVSVGLHKLGDPSLALAWAGGDAGRQLENGLNHLGVQTDFIWVEEETRTNTYIKEENSEWFIRLNEQGPHISQAAIQQMLDKVQSHAFVDDIWVISGSLPQAVPPDYYRDLISILHEKSCRVFFETTGPAFDAGKLETPYFVKPELEDAEKYLGSPIKTYEDAKRSALAFLRSGIQYVALQLEKSEVLLASQSEIVLANLPGSEPVNDHGITGAIMAGIVHGFANGLTIQEAARWSAAFGNAVIRKGGMPQVELGDVQNLLPKVDVRLFNVM